MHYKMGYSNIRMQNLVLVNLKCITYVQPTLLPSCFFQLVYREFDIMFLLCATRYSICNFSSLRLVFVTSVVMYLEILYIGMGHMKEQRDTKQFKCSGTKIF